MFKASYPWAKKSEEDDERTYLKSFDTTSHDDVAGNVWVPERFGAQPLTLGAQMPLLTTVAALELAEEYGITAWVLALLDPAPVIPANEDKEVASPPKFVFTAGDKDKMAAVPALSPVKGRGRPKAGSPAKLAAGGKQSSPRKRNTKAVKEANAAAARQASENLQAVLDTTAPSVTESTADSEQVEDEKVVVNIKSAVEVKGDVETTHTNVQIKMPAGAPDLPLPESTEDMITKAKQMVEEATKLDGEASAAKKGKRKAEAVEEEEEAAKEFQVAKRPKLEQEVRKQRVRNRALFGVAASLAIGYVHTPRLPCDSDWEANFLHSAIVPFVLGG